VGCRQGFARCVEHMRGSDGEWGQALLGIQSGRGQACSDASGGRIHGALSRAAEEARVRRAQRRDWGREQGTDVGADMRERGLTVGHGHYVGFR
jgi:hypothetical protein